MKLLFTTLALLIFAQGRSEDISWSFPPSLLSTNAFNASDAHISTDPNGNLAAIWIENSILKARSKPLNMPWTSLVSISSSGNISHPKIVSGFDGTVTALWLQNGLVLTASKMLGGNWSVSTTLSSPGSSSPVLAIDNMGNLVAAWVQGNSIKSSIKPYLGAWSAKTSISGAAPTDLSLASGGAGSSSNIVLVWQDNTVASGPGIYSSTRNLLNTWSQKQLISASEGSSQFAKPRVAVDVNGNATAVWFSYNVINDTFNNVTVQSANLPFQQQWSMPVQLSQPGTCNPASLVASIACDGSGNALALWNLSFDGQTFNIETAVKPVVGNWSAPVDLVASNTYAYSADASVSMFGDAITAYMFYNSHGLLTQTASSNITGFSNNNWSVPVTISSGTENAFPKVVSTVTGNAINAASVWLENNGSHNVVVASTGNMPLLLPPQNVSVAQQSRNFGVFTETYNLVNWQASMDPSTIGYSIYRNGQFLAQVDASILQYVDDNQPQNSATIYGVSAFNAFNVTSAIITAQ